MVSRPTRVRKHDKQREMTMISPEHERRRWPRPASEEPSAPPGSPALAPLHFSTRGLAAADQFSAWQAQMELLVEVRLPDERSPEDGFPADHTAWNLGGMLIVQQKTPAYSYMRSAAMLRSSPIDHWYVSIPRSGRTWTEVNGHVAEGKAGNAEFRSLAYPFRGRTVESDVVLLYMPRDLFADTSGILDSANNSILSGNFANLLIDYVNNVEAILHSLLAEDLPRVVHTIRDMVIACLSSAGRSTVTEHQANIGLMERARRHIQRNLHSPDLTPDTLCRTLGISRTRLYQLFEPSDGVLHYIRKRRLLAAHAALGDPANNQRILDIAEAVGFDSAANFSRAFSQEFGYSPREARNAATSERLAYAAPHAERENAPSFEAWLKSLGS